MATKTKETKGLVINRIFEVPRDLVWQAWSDPEYYKRWYGPKDYTCPACTMDFRVNGTVHVCMRSPEGNDFWSIGTYKEIIPLRKIVCTDSFGDADGNKVPASHYGMPDFPEELLVTVTFEDLNGKTAMTLVHYGLPQDEHLAQVRAGWNESFDKLNDYLKNISQNKE